jgi:hypothetical protein
VRDRANGSAGTGGYIRRANRIYLVDPDERRVIEEID